MDSDRRATVTARATGHVVSGAALDMAGCLTGRMADPSVAGYVDGRRQYSRCRGAVDGDGGGGPRGRPPRWGFGPAGGPPSPPAGGASRPLSTALPPLPRRRR